MKNLGLILILGFLVFGCGVKGKPLPPKKPRGIGIGEPRFQGVDDELKKNSKEEKEKK
ncbi:MAG: hypothetical protein AAF203_00195 [Pseudomonadota bacterium]